MSDAARDALTKLVSGIDISTVKIDDKGRIVIASPQGDNPLKELLGGGVVHPFGPIDPIAFLDNCTCNKQCEPV